MGEQLTFWTARLAMMLYACALAWMLLPGSGKARWIWTAGCAVFVIHVVCAFQFVHHWSHADAYAATARRTKELVGLDWGGGLYFNYLFTLIWLADVGWWWLAPARYETRPRVVAWLVHGFMIFMAVNATIVFAAGFTRWLAVAACLLLAGLWYRRGH